MYALHLAGRCRKKTQSAGPTLLATYPRNDGDPASAATHNLQFRRAGPLCALACLPQLAFQLFRELRSLQQEEEAYCVMDHDTECGHQVPLLPYRDGTALCAACTVSQSPADVMR